MYSAWHLGIMLACVASTGWGLYIYDVQEVYSANYANDTYVYVPCNMNRILNESCEIYVVGGKRRNLVLKYAFDGTIKKSLADRFFVSNDSEYLSLNIKKNSLADGNLYVRVERFELAFLPTIVTLFLFDPRPAQTYVRERSIRACETSGSRTCLARLLTYNRQI